MRGITRSATLLLISWFAFAIAVNAQTGVIYGNGSVYVNGAQLNKSSAVMPGDVIQTKETGVAQVTAMGSSATLQSNTIVRFQSGGLALDRGTISMGTGKSSSIFARDFKITPVSVSWTQFDVIRTSGAIQIFARKNNLTVSCGTGAPVVVKEGEQISRDDGADCGLAQKPGDAPTAAKGPILGSPTAEKAGLAVGGGLLGWVLFQADEPVSPFAP
jgi:ferric-dicitrate binding protein FerR (iron transport regulator)